jgi:uncharacterized protein
VPAQEGAGSTDLALLLREMRPRLAGEPCVFTTTSSPGLEALAAALGTFREEEGVTLILELEPARRLGLQTAGLWARITLDVHSSLHAVGLMARVTAALAGVGISCNPVSAWYHDHLFVPWEQRQQALAALAAVAAVAPTTDS